MEIWKDVVGYEGLYQVSNYGKVRSLDRNIKYKDGRVYYTKGKILKAHLQNNGYLIAHLNKNGKIIFSKTVLISSHSISIVFIISF